MFMLSLGYLTSRQAEIWDHRRQGQTIASIAKKLEKSVQFIHKTLQKTDTKIIKSVLEVAKLNDISIRGDINTVQGIAFGYHERFHTDVTITYSKRYGIQIWYKDNGNCKECRILQECREAVIELYRERSYPLPEDYNHIEPRILTETLFTHLKESYNPA